MSFVVVTPELLAAAATDLKGIGSALNAANSVAAAATTGVAAAASDEVSAAIASLFSEHGQAYQWLSSELAYLYQQFVQALNGAALSYDETEAVDSATLAYDQQLEEQTSSPG